MNKVYLIGFMGVGKSSIGKKLARELGYNFIDLDDAFEKKYKISIHRFFEKYGEELFRELEYQLLTSTFKISNVVVATGGGTVCYHDAMGQMNLNGLTVYLKMPVGGIVERLKNVQRKRPLITGKNETELLNTIIERLDNRLPYYQMAGITLDVIDIDMTELVERIKKEHNE